MSDATDLELRDRAKKVIPSGMWGHLHVARQPVGYPQYFVRGEGCRIWDANGREYIDFMCSYGPIVLGHHDPDVDRAAAAQAVAGDCLNGPAPVLVDLAELMVETVPHADWATFQKNGTDAMQACVMIARAGTGRRKLLVARKAYHGAALWCTPSQAGVLPEDRTHQIFYDYNDVASLEAAAAEAGDDLAGVLVTAIRHDLGRDHEMPTPAFAAAARRICDRTGAALILDDVRASFRLDVGGSWELVGVRPDLAGYSKAIGNGHPLAAVTGSERFRDAGARIFVTGSFWCAAVPMAAAIATIRKLKEIDGPARMRAAGERLRAGLAAQAAAHGVAIRQSGPPQMPLVLFEDDADVAKGSAFCLEALKHGVYLHPVHTMFLSTAHGDAEIDRALEGTDRAFRAVAERFGHD